MVSPGHDDYDASVALSYEGVYVDDIVRRGFDVWCGDMQHNKEGSPFSSKLRTEYGARNMTRKFDWYGFGIGWRLQLDEFGPAS